MKKSKLFFVLVILVIALICIFIRVNNSILTGNAVATQSIEITENNFAQFFTFTDMVSDLPKDSAIVIKTPKKTFVVTKGLIKEGTIENPDASLSLDSKVFPFPSN